MQVNDLQEQVTSEQQATTAAKDQLAAAKGEAANAKEEAAKANMVAKAAKEAAEAAAKARAAGGGGDRHTPWLPSPERDAQDPALAAILRKVGAGGHGQVLKGIRMHEGPMDAPALALPEEVGLDAQDIPSVRFACSLGCSLETASAGGCACQQPQS